MKRQLPTRSIKDFGAIRWGCPRRPTAGPMGNGVPDRGEEMTRLSAPQIAPDRSWSGTLEHHDPA